MDRKIMIKFREKLLDIVETYRKEAEEAEDAIVKLVKWEKVRLMQDIIIATGQTIEESKS